MVASIIILKFSATITATAMAVNTSAAAMGTAATMLVARMPTIIAAAMGMATAATNLSIVSERQEGLPWKNGSPSWGGCPFGRT